MTMDFPFEELSGNLDVLAFRDQDEDPNTVLEIERHWYVRPHWFVDGPGAKDLGGTWHLAIIVESIGAGVERTLKTIDIPITQLGPGPVTHPLEYRPWIHIPSRVEDPDHAIMQDGLYRLAAVLTYTNEFGHHGRMAGYIEGPLLQFYHFED